MKISLSSIIIVLILSISADSAGQFSPPVKGNIAVTSLFGDYRPGHFHAGLDIRTGGKPGRRLYAIDDGYIWRITTSFNGYGKSLYLKTNSGHYAVYAHLSGFFPELSTFVNKQQIEARNYRTNLFFKPNQFPVKRGDFIALSGESGAGQPHLHFELRSPDNRPVNPLNGFIGIFDKKPPLFKSIAVVKYGEKLNPGSITSFNEYACFKPNNSASYTIQDDIITSGRFAFELNGYDLLNDYYGKFGIYQLSMYFNGQLIYLFRADTIDFVSTRQNEYVRDHQQWVKKIKTHPNPKRIDKDRYTYYRLFRLPGDIQPTTKVIVGSGYFSSDPRETLDVNKVSKGKHYVTIIASDANGNNSELVFTINVVDDTASDVLNDTRSNQSDVVIAESGISFFDDAITLGLNEKEMYYPEDFNIKWVDDNKGYVDYEIIKQFEILPQFTYFKKPVDMTVQLDDLEAPPENYCIGWEDINGKYVFAGSQYDKDNNTTGCKIGATGKFAVIIDSIPPEIVLLKPLNGSSLKQTKTVAIRYKMEDNFSGLGNEEDLILLIDGEWIPAEYDIDRDLILFNTRTKLGKGKHTLSISVTDQCGNSSELESYFVIK
ncbi:MAG: M23 family metallopeptidase [candidate division Zixibacteria bacterium]|nr:M23 family metallopeptidase [candidate division Zixibacteria bacterium]